MINNKEIKNLENYLDMKRKELEKEKNELVSVTEERNEYVNTKTEIEQKIKELKGKEDSTEGDLKHISSLEGALDTYEEDILRLTVEIVTKNEIIEDLSYDIEMTEKELELEKDK